VYEKGAELIRMLKTLIGPDAFARGMDLYFERHDGEAVTIEDFYACFEAASGRDLADFRRWYAQAGTPHVQAEKAFDAASGRLTLTLRQQTPATPGQPEKAPVPIPLDTALLGPDGHVLERRLIELTGAEATVVFEGLGAMPMVSLNRGFSAPVIVDWADPDQAGLAMAEIEDDPFNRWDLLQRQTAACILDMAGRPGADVAGEAADAVVRAVIAAAGEDPAYAALLMRAPTVGELFLQKLPAEPAALDAARNRWRRALMAHGAMAEFCEEVLDTPSPAPFEPSAEQAGVRALRTAMIAGLGSLGATAEPKLAALYASATNMTEQLACLRSLVEAAGPDHPQVAAFHAQWSDNPLIVDKWFGALSVLAASAAEVEALVAHPDFDLANPNRVRAVVGSFAMQNLAAFHAEDGSGHRFLAEIARVTDARNPALAARLLTAFEQWRALEPKARASAEAVLETLAGMKLSQNSADIIARCRG